MQMREDELEQELVFYKGLSGYVFRNPYMPL